MEGHSFCHADERGNQLPILHMVPGQQQLCKYHLQSYDSRPVKDRST
jgi:hypothetical protein